MLTVALNADLLKTLGSELGALERPRDLRRRSRPPRAFHPDAGDPPGTVYAGGNPLFDMKTAEMRDRYEHIVAHHPDRPWRVGGVGR
jgi:hypothetical protein